MINTLFYYFMRLGALGRSFDKADKFCEVFFAFLHTNPFLKRVLL